MALFSKPTPERPELDALIEKAKQHKMTLRERYEQRISWVYGQLAIENPKITKEMVRQVAEEIYGPPPPEDS